jgi:hypothetical protein
MRTAINHKFQGGAEKVAAAFVDQLSKKSLPVDVGEFRVFDGC